MQNNVTELTQKLLRSLDSNYNVIDMPAVIEVISQLEKIAITKELLETTRLGKYVNQLRRNTTNKLLAKRAKDLVKKWRDTVLPDSNGQLKHTQDEPPSKKRPLKDPTDVQAPNVKRPRVNGQMCELDFSDNSNSSFKDTAKSVIIINSDSNSSVPDHRNEPPLEQQQPKKRGRKKGSKNHKNLIEEAETSFSNKLSVSRGNAKVKTTQELLADLHIKSNNALAGKPLEDLNEKAAKLSERVSIIDQKLNATSNRYNRNFQRKSNVKTEVIESGIVSNVRGSDDEIIIVDDAELDVKTEGEEEEEEENREVKVEMNPGVPKSLTVEEALALLPPIDRTVLEEKDAEPCCTCQLIESKTDFSTEDDENVKVERSYEFVEDDDCTARNYFVNKYNLSLNSELLSRQLSRLHTECIPGVNGSYGVGNCKAESKRSDDGLYVNVVPNVNTENLLKFSSMDYSQPASENFKKYSISEPKIDDDSVEVGVAKNESVSVADGDSDTHTFREWHEVLDTPSYDGEIFKILPYVIID